MNPLGTACQAHTILHRETEVLCQVGSEPLLLKGGSLSDHPPHHHQERLKPFHQTAAPWDSCAGRTPGRVGGCAVLASC